MLAEIRAAGKPACGHNMLFDLVFVLNIFGGDYPTWAEFKNACELFFPAGIYDTKHVFKGVEKRTGRLLSSNHLGDVYAALKDLGVCTEADAEKQSLVREVLQKARDEAGTPNGHDPTSPCLPVTFDVFTWGLYRRFNGILAFVRVFAYLGGHLPVPALMWH